MSAEVIVLGAAALCLVLAALWLLGRHGDDDDGGDADGGGPTGGRGRGGSEGGRQQLE